MAENYTFKDKSKLELLRFLEAYQMAINESVICSVTDTKGIIIYVNKKFCEVSKYTEEELIGQNHRILNAGYHSTTFFKEMWMTISAGEMWRNEVKSIAKDGSYFWQDSIILPVFDENHVIIQYFSIRIPIDERKKAEEEKEHRIKDLEEILFKISHEVRHPVTLMLGICNMFDEPMLSQEEIGSFINALKHAAEKLNVYTREITEVVSKLRDKEDEV
ncbi:MULTISPECIES: PAS domain S-box protein [unclassified Arcicella]|uniref:PAS domain-containing protein n=1 Tax=unclassified Arcicella TaxID=2644986 RepID=UPI00286358A4|nr:MULTISPECIES: PAS domain S-box protein [unclassified Arcicella]MDR6561837.1 PAS domain S-box-containing protein [Arcicella sp. BE51]MDR6813983.1 PAS domain S-box-containing protein [Arcicella sp. BE140]MDR6825310.1 PAS domain S-box-containing protein [Arcicella sp. BE139]